MSLNRLERELLETVEWAVDVIRLYDKQLIRLGEPEKLVYSNAHKAGIQKAEDVIKRAKSGLAPRWP